MRLPPGDYCNSWLVLGDDKILGGGPYRLVSTGIISLDIFGIKQRHTRVKI